MIEFSINDLSITRTQYNIDEYIEIPKITNIIREFVFIVVIALDSPLCRNTELDPIYIHFTWL